MKRIGSILTVVAASVLMAFAPVQAAPLIDFLDYAGSGGTITYNGSYFIGEDIAIGTVRFSPTGSPADYLPGHRVTGTVVHQGNYYGDLDFSTESGKDFFTIVGGVPDFGIPDGTTLLDGRIYCNNANYPSGEISFQICGVDYKNERLQAAFGVDYAEWKFTGFIKGVKVPGATGVFEAYSSDIGNRPVPEPSTIILLGAGLLGLGLIRRRKQVR